MDKQVSDKIFKKSVLGLIDVISDEFKIDKVKLSNIFDKWMLEDLGIKKRPINPNNYCMARKLNLDRCTRNKKNNCDFCPNHQYNHPYGRIDEPIKNTLITIKTKKLKKTKKTQSLENCKTKTKSKQTKEKKDKIIKLKLKLIGDREYFIDNKNYLYIIENNNNNSNSSNSCNSSKIYRHIGIWNESEKSINFIEKLKVKE